MIDDLRFPPLTERALFQRLKRHMEKHYNERLHKNRPDSRSFQFLGTYYTVDTYTNTIVKIQMDLEKWARDEKVMHPNEKLAGKY